MLNKKNVPINGVVHNIRGYRSGQLEQTENFTIIRHSEDPLRNYRRFLQSIFLRFYRKRPAEEKSFRIKHIPNSISYLRSSYQVFRITKKEALERGMRHC